MSSLTIKKIMLTLCCVTLTACGGGSDGDNEGSDTTATVPPKVETPSPTISLSLGQSSLAINEQEEAKVALTSDYTGTGDIVYAITFAPILKELSAQIIDNELVITASELKNTLTSTLTVTASSSNGDVTAINETINLSLINTSVDPLLAEVELWKDSEQVFKFDDFDNAITFYTKSAYFNGGLDNSAVTEKVAEFTTIKQNALEQISSAEVTLLVNASANYQNNSISETELQAILSNVKTLAGAQYNKLAQHINVLASLTNNTTPALPSLTYQFNDRYQAFSGIIGNTQMGAFDGDTWTFNQEYLFLNTLIPVLGNTTNCQAI